MNFKGYRTEGVLTRLRLGQLVAKHPSGLCEICQKEGSVGHRLMEGGYETERGVMRAALRDKNDIKIIIGSGQCGVHQGIFHLEGIGIVYRL